MRNHAQYRIRAALAYGVLCAVALSSLLAGSAHASAVFKCVGADGAIAFQATPCTAGTQQTSIDIREQPPIDPNAPNFASVSLSKSSTGRGRDHAFAGARANGRIRHSTAKSNSEQPVSYECRAADGEVFYRHARCPGSIPGDGIARFGVEPSGVGTRHGGRRSHGGAWAPVPVSARKISRDEACRAINATAASGRDGHARDEQVSVYEHNVGRDPCSGY